MFYGCEGKNIVGCILNLIAVIILVYALWNRDIILIVSAILLFAASILTNKHTKPKKKKR